MRLMCHLISISRLRMGKLKSSLDLIWRARVPALERRYVSHGPAKMMLMIGWVEAQVHTTGWPSHMLHSPIWLRWGVIPSS